MGAGTGKLTSALLDNASEVVAVEPQHTMLLRLARDLPGAYAACARAEELSIKSGWADLVIAGQAFHWFDQSQALTQIARVLKSRGHVALIWNVRDESVDWVAQLARITGSDNSKETRTTLSSSAPFGQFEVRRYQMGAVLDKAGLVAQVHSRSHVATLGASQRREITEAVLRLCDSHPDLAGKSDIEFPYTTEAFKAEKV